MKYHKITASLCAGVCLLAFGIHESACILPAAANDTAPPAASEGTSRGSGSGPIGVWHEENGTTAFTEWHVSTSADDQLRLDRPPYQLSYSVYEDLDLDGATISGCGFDHEPLSDHMDMVDTSEFKHEQGKYWITVHGETNDTGFYVYVRSVDSTSNCCYYINLVSEPNKVVYQIGEELDLTGAVLDICGDNDKLTDHMDMVDAWDFDNTTPGEYCIKISDYMIGRECEFYVTVVGSTDSNPTSGTTVTTTTNGTYVDYEQLTIKHLPTKTIYQVGEALDLTGGIFEGNGHMIGYEEFNYDWFNAKMSDYPYMINDAAFDNTKPGLYDLVLKGKLDSVSFRVQVIPKITELSGDANGDNQRTIGDAILMARVLAEDWNAEISDEGLERADIDGINDLTKEDLTLLLQILANIIK